MQHYWFVNTVEVGLTLSKYINVRRYGLIDQPKTYVMHGIAKEGRMMESNYHSLAQWLMYARETVIIAFDQALSPNWRALGYFLHKHLCISNTDPCDMI